LILSYFFINDFFFYNLNCYIVFLDIQMRINHILFFSLLCFAAEGKAVEPKWTDDKIQHLKPKQDFLDPKKQGLTQIRPLMKEKIALVIQPNFC